MYGKSCRNKISIHVKRTCLIFLTLLSGAGGVPGLGGGLGVGGVPGAGGVPGIGGVPGVIPGTGGATPGVLNPGAGGVYPGGKFRAN